MSKKFKKIFVFICFISTSTFAQNLEFDGSFILFREAKTKEPVLIINDSLLYKGMKPIKLPFKFSDYPEKLQQYIPFNIKDKTYLVHSGCGPVLEFRNDSIVRINDAYLQRNQYGAVHFVYKNEIYFFGGYGFFENNITHHFEIDQQISRVRQPKEIKVWISPRNMSYETEISIVKADILRGNLVANVDVQVSEVIFEETVKDDDNKFLRLATVVEE